MCLSYNDQDYAANLILLVFDNRRAKKPIHMVRELRMPKMAAGISTAARSRVFRLVDKPPVIFSSYIRTQMNFFFY